MRVAILTQPLGHNYGGLLQAWALQQLLVSLGCDVVTIDRRAARPSLSARWRQELINRVRLALGRIRSLPDERNLAVIQAELRCFRDQQLVMSPCFRDQTDLQGYFQAQSFDAVVVGSDQVWRPDYSPALENFFLDFLDEIESSARRVAFSASFGVDEWLLSEEQTARAGELLAGFDAISVRESSAITLCQQHLNLTPRWTLDPTLLLTPADYDACLEPVDIGEMPPLVSYLLDRNSEKQVWLNRVARQMGQASIAVLPEQRWWQTPRNQLAACRYRPVGEWLFLFKHAGLVVTDSFHGCVFALLFNRPFIALGNRSRGQARFASLLAAFGLQDRLLDPASAVDQLQIDQLLHPDSIDWDLVNQKLQQERQVSLAFLQEALWGQS